MTALGLGSATLGLGSATAALGLLTTAKLGGLDLKGGAAAPAAAGNIGGA